MLDSIQNLATFLSSFYVKFWLCSANATISSQLNLGLLKLLEDAKTKVRNPVTIKMVETAYAKLKNHLWYLSEQMQSLNIRTKPVLIANKFLNQEDLGAKLLKLFVGSDLRAFFQLLQRWKEQAFVTKRVQKYSTQE